MNSSPEWADRTALLAAARARADELRRGLFARIRGDIRRHGGTFFTRSVLALAIYRFGAFALTRSRPTRFVLMKFYGLLDRLSRTITGLNMDCRAIVGDEFHLVHLEAPISIHPDTVIGDRVGIMHSVTIGTAEAAGLPIIGNDVFIGVGAVILGPVVIGDGARIGANSLVISDVPPGATAIGVPAKVLRRLATAPLPRSAAANGAIAVDDASAVDDSGSSDDSRSSDESSSPEDASADAPSSGDAAAANHGAKGSGR